MSTNDLTRFVTAQSDTYATALAEIRTGKKLSHWMWFIFPQVDGLGFSAMSVRYAIASIEEARAYLAHPILGARLREITEAMNALPDNNPASILGQIDASKFLSSMTLFGAIADENCCYRHAIDKFFGGCVDEQTTRIMNAW